VPAPMGKAVGTRVLCADWSCAHGAAGGLSMLAPCACQIREWWERGAGKPPHPLRWKGWRRWEGASHSSATSPFRAAISTLLRAPCVCSLPQTIDKTMELARSQSTALPAAIPADKLRLIGGAWSRDIKRALLRSGNHVRCCFPCAHTAVLPKIPHSNCCKRVPNRPLRGRRGRFGTLLQLLECGIFGRTAIGRDGTTPLERMVSMAQAESSHGMW